MARRPSTPELPSKPSLDARTALRLLSDQLRLGEELAQHGVEANPYRSWATQTQMLVARSFGERSSESNNFSVADADSQPISSLMGPENFAKIREDALNAQLNFLRAFTNVLRLTADVQGDRAEPSSPRSIAESKLVFIVHGHDGAAKEAVARFVEKLGLKAIILHEQPNRGRTIIEKFEAHADVAFAIVLLTMDDRGGPMATAYEQQKPRARQNVILELGYFLGKLGRERVCALVVDGVERPSDIDGVVYVAMDQAGAWHLLLARELRQVLPTVDLNAL